MHTQMIQHFLMPWDTVPMLSLAMDENRATLRLLSLRSDVPWFDSPELSEGDASELLATDRLIAEKRYYVLEGKEFLITEECLLDRTSPGYAENWQPGTHVIFYRRHGGGLAADVKSGLTYFSRYSTGGLVQNTGHMVLLHLWVMDKNAPVSSCDRRLITSSGTRVITNFPLGEVWEGEAVFSPEAERVGMACQLEADRESVPPGGFVTFTLTLRDAAGELMEEADCNHLMVEAVDGYAPHRRIAVRGGVGTFRVQALGLEGGESLRVNVNTRHYTSLCEKIVPVEEGAE